jgi:hypothetical protein
MKVIFRLMLFGGITIIVIAFYMRVYCHDHTSLSTQTPNTSPLTLSLPLHCSPAVLAVLTSSTAASILQIPVATFRSPGVPAFARSFSSLPFGSPGRRPTAVPLSTPAPLQQSPLIGQITGKSTTVMTTYFGNSSSEAYTSITMSKSSSSSSNTTISTSTAEISPMEELEGVIFSYSSEL